MVGEERCRCSCNNGVMLCGSLFNTDQFPTPTITVLQQRNKNIYVGDTTSPLFTARIYFGGLHTTFSHARIQSLRT